MNANELKIFNYENNQIRTTEINGEIWWVAKDVCDVFGETNRNRAMQFLSDDEKGYTQMTTPKGVQNLAIINEAGLYSLLFAMQPAKAKARGVSDEVIIERQNKLKKFKRWVTHEVLPSIRKHGAYITLEKIQEYMTKPENWIELLQKVRDEQQKNAELQNQIDRDRPKVVFAEAVDASDATIYLGEFARILRQNGIEIGQNRLFQRLREGGFLIQRNGRTKNMPTQKAVEAGLLKIEEDVTTSKNGHISVNQHVKITDKGQIFFANYFADLTRNESVEIDDVQENLIYL